MGHVYGGQRKAGGSQFSLSLPCELCAVNAHVRLGSKYVYSLGCLSRRDIPLLIRNQVYHTTTDPNNLITIFENFILK